jgi:hypothetical protein
VRIQNLLYESRKDKALQLVSYKLSDARSFRAERLAGLASGDYCTEDGIPLPAEAQKVASEIFAIVRRGVSILPKGDLEKVIRREREKQSQALNKDISPRTWGQEFLTSQDPLKIIPGALFGDGSQWKIYVFSTCIIAEANKSACGTYVGTPTALNTFLTQSRRDILEKRPPELLAHLIHTGDSEYARQKWRSAVTKYLTHPFDPRVGIFVS